MLRNVLLLLFAALSITALAACSKSKESAAETKNAPMAEQAEQPGALPPAIATAIDTGPASATEIKSSAMSMKDGMALAQKSNCLACHLLDKKLVGPAWIDVAKRYRGMPNGEHALIIKISTGGAGNWGDMPMPAMAPAVKEEDIRALVKFILSLDKQS